MRAVASEESLRAQTRACWVAASNAAMVIYFDGIVAVFG
jgi:hypothetical protein